MKGEANFMTKSDATRPSLLVRIRDARDREAWGEFVEIYAPLVYKTARRRGLQDSDAADLTQEVLRSVMGKDVAASLGMTVGAVYIAKSRVLSRIKEQVRQLLDH
jgi:DNA-directed RNA polymerase specialized sigma24 family protein